MISPRVPVNASCPCGSGRKYKNCCWKREKREYATGRSAVSEAMAGVMQLIDEDSDAEIRETVTTILDELVEEYRPEQVKAVMENYDVFFTMCVNDCCAADLPLEDGRKLIDIYIERQRKPLHPIALEFLENWKRSSLSLYEIRKVDLRKSLDLYDMFSRKQFTVVNSTLSEHAEPGHTFFTRVIKVGNEYLLSPTLLPMDPLSAEDLVIGIRHIRNNTPGSATLTWGKFFKKHWHLIPELWFEEQLLRTVPPVLHNTDGDPIDAFRITCHLKPGSLFKANAILAAVDGMERVSPKAFNYVVEASEKNQTAMDNVVLATLELTEEDLTVDVNSFNRADRITALLENWLGELIVSMEREPVEYDPGAAQRHMQPEDEIPPEIREDILLEFFDKHMRKWMDEPIPALRGLTPRQASKKAGPRKRLMILLRDMENGPPPGCESYDFSWMWKELGLKRNK